MAEVTFYRFMSEVRSFLSKLKNNPIKAKPSKFLLDNGVSKSKLIRDLISRDVLERHERILDSTNSDEKKAKYCVKYKVKKTDFEERIHRIYIKYFEENLPDKSDKENLDECEGGDCGGGDIGGTSSFGVGSETTDGSVGFVAPLAAPIHRATMYTNRKKKNETKPEDILGKDITAEGRTIRITEEQFQRILNEEGLGGTSSFSVGVTGSGDLLKGCPIEFRTSDGKPDPTLTKIKVKQVMNK